MKSLSASFSRKIFNLLPFLNSKVYATPREFTFVFLSFLLFLPICCFAQLKIGIIGDQTGSSNLPQSYAVLQEGCQAISEANPDIVLHVGDLVESSQSDSDIETSFTQAVSYLNAISKPWYITAGDHDVNPPNDYTPGTKNTEKADLFFNLLRNEYSKRPSCIVPDNLYYSFNFQEYHFICLYSEDCLRTDPRWGNIFMDKISDEQFNWLEGDLNASSFAKGIVVLIHQPMWYNPTGWKKVHDLLRKYHVLAVVAGHFHYNQDEGYTDGIRYVVVGSTGGTIKDASENAGGLYHVTLLTLDDNNKISLQLIPLKDYSYNQFSDRENMDRVQAIDTMLSNIEWTPGVTIEGNPIDIPVDIYSSANQGTWNLLYKNVPPGTGVSISNLSSVELNSDTNRPSNLQGMKIQFIDGKGQMFWDSMQF